MAYQETLTLEVAEAKFISSLSYLVWVYFLSIIVAAYLAIEGYILPEALLNGVVKIILTMIWIYFLLKLVKLIDKFATKHWNLED